MINDYFSHCFIGYSLPLHLLHRPHPPPPLSLSRQTCEPVLARCFVFRHRGALTRARQAGIPTAELRNSNFHMFQFLKKNFSREPSTDCPVPKNLISDLPCPTTSEELVLEEQDSLSPRPLTGAFGSDNLDLARLDSLRVTPPPSCAMLPCPAKNMAQEPAPRPLLKRKCLVYLATPSTCWRAAQVTPRLPDSLARCDSVGRKTVGPDSNTEPCVGERRRGQGAAEVSASGE